MRASRSLALVLGVALASTAVASVPRHVHAADNPFAGAWTGSGKLLGHGSCASGFELVFEIDGLGAIKGMAEMSHGSHGFAGEYRVTGSVDGDDGQLDGGRMAKSWTVELKGRFTGDGAEGTAIFGGEASCFGDWRAHREAAAKAEPDAVSEPSAAPSSEPASCGDSDDTRRRLEAVDKLLKDGLINAAEAEAKRKALLDCL